MKHKRMSALLLSIVMLLSLLPTNIAFSADDELNIEYITLAGDGEGYWLNNVKYDPTDMSNKMTEESPGVYKISYDHLPSVGTYTFKFYVNGNEEHKWGNAEPQLETKTPVTFDSNYTVRFSLNDGLEKKSKITITLDLTEFDYETKTGAYCKIERSVDSGGAFFITVPTGKTKLAYSGEEQTLASSGWAKNGTIMYSLSENGEYSETVPTAKDIGDYTVWFYILANGATEYTGTKLKTTAKISKKELDYTITANNVTYGEDLDIECSGLDGLTEGVDYELQYTVAYKDQYTNTVPTTAGSYQVKAVLKGDAVNNYTINGDAKFFQIEQKTVNLVVAADKLTKVYDGTPNINITADDISIKEGDVLEDDAVSLKCNSDSCYEDSYAGNEKEIMLDVELDGYDKDNYLVEQKVTGSITPKPLTLEKSSTATISKVYDATKSATVTYACDGDTNADGANILIKGIVGGDDTPTLTYKAEYNDENCKEAETVTVSNFGLSGEGSGNYTVQSAEPLKFEGEIKRAVLTFPQPSLDDVEIGTEIYGIRIPITATGVNNEEFPGYAVITSSDKGEVVAATTHSGLAWDFVADECPATPITNYSNYDHEGNNAMVTGKNKTRLTPSLVTKSKEYDGKPANVEIGGLDVLTAGTDYVVKYRKAGTTTDTTESPIYKGDYILSIELQGDADKKYEIDSSADRTYEIKAKPLTIGNLNVTKEYDGDTQVKGLTLADVTTALVGVIDGDTVNAVNADGRTFYATYDNKTVGNGKTVTLHDIDLDNDNYWFYSAEASGGVITPKSVTLTPAADTKITKVYDGTTNGRISDDDSSAYLTVNGVADGDNVKPSYSGCTVTFGDKNVGDDIDVTVSGAGITGDDSQNYKVADESSAVTLKGEITKANLTAPATVEALNVPIGSDIYGYLIKNVVATGVTVDGTAETVTGTAQITELMMGKVKAETEYSCMWKFISDEGQDDVTKNYNTTLTGSNARLVGAKKTEITPTLTVEDKVYDGQYAVATVSGMDGFVQGTDYKITYKEGGSEYGVVKHVGTFDAKIELIGDAAEKYVITGDSYKTTVTISPKALTISSIDGLTKSYDGTKSVPATITNDALEAAISGYVDGDTGGKFGVTSFRAEYDSSGVDAEKIIITDINVSNPQIAGRYTIPERVEMPATITPISLTAAWNNDAISKTYDGTTAVDVTDKITLSGALAGETPTIATCVGQFADKNVGTGINVSAEEVELDSSNPLNKNYNLASNSVNFSGDITQATLAMDTPPRATDVEIGTPIEAYVILATANGVNGETFAGKVTFTDTDRGNVAAEQEYDNLNWTFSVLLQGQYKKSNYSNADTLTGSNGYIKGKAKEQKTAVLEIEDKVYDGTAVSPKTATVDGLTEGTDFEVRYSTDNSTWSANAPINAGTYTAKIVLKGESDDKFTIAESTDTFTISKAKVKLAYDGEISKTYDGDTVANVDASKVAVKSAVDGSDIAGVGVEFSGDVNASYESKNVGEGIAVTVANAKLRENNSDAVNYEFAENGTKLTGKITKANVTVKIGDVSKTYGVDYTNYTDYDVDFAENGNGGIASESVRAEILGEIKALITAYASDGAVKTAAVSGYDITATITASETDNATVTVEKGTMTVTKAPLTVRVKDVSREYGSANPELEVIYVGFVNDETQDVLTGELVLEYDTSINVETAVGTYEDKTTASGVTADNYDITFESGDVEITKIPVTASAGAATASCLTVEFDKAVEGVTFTVKSGDTAVKVTNVTASGDKKTYTLNGTFTVDTEYTVEITYASATQEITEGQTLTMTPVRVASSGGSTTITSTYTVKFESNGGSKVKNVTVEKNETVAEPTAPTKDGFVFEGWYTDKGLTTEYDFDTAVTKSITLYAKWSEKSYENPDDSEDNKQDEQDNQGNQDEEQSPTPSEWENPFTDVADWGWFYDSVRYVRENGLMDGITDTEFEPEMTLTRSMLVTVLYRAAGKPEVGGDIVFGDVTADKYYADAVIWAEQNDIVDGVGDGKFAPDENITREQIATIIYRYAQSIGVAPTGAWAIKLDYADIGEISDYAVEGVMYCTLNGIMQGKDDNMFAPKDNATRAEIAAILNRFIENSK